MGAGLPKDSKRWTKKAEYQAVFLHAAKNPQLARQLRQALELIPTLAPPGR